MALPFSLQTGNFLSLGKFFFQNILKDDYPHKKFEVENYKAITQNNNIIKYKTEISRINENNKTRFKMNDELIYGIKFGNQVYLQTRVKRDGETKYHFDLGKLLKKKNLECFVACKTNIAFNKYWARFGIGEQNENLFYCNRIEKNFEGQYSLSSQLGSKHGDFYFGLGQIFNLSEKKFEKCDLVCNYNNKRGFDLTLQHLSIKNANKLFPLGKILTAIAYQLNKQISIAAWKQRMVIGVSSKLSDSLQVKAKTDCNYKTSLSSKFKISPAIQCVVGIQLPAKELIKNIKNVNLDTLCKLPFGYSFDINL